MTWIIWPPWDTWSTVGYGLFAVLCLSFGFLEKFGLLQLNYSKFRKSKGISSRRGMFVLYALPALVYTWVAAADLRTGSLIQWILFAAVTGHFIKRCLEVLFVHKYSGPIDRMTVVQIAAAYSLATGLMAHLHENTIAHVDGLFIIGGVLFISAEFFNFSHHRLLANLRGGAGDTNYRIPSGGLFPYVTAPHYLMEIGAWLGLALMSRHLAAYMIWVWTSGYLVGRAMRTHAYYRRNFVSYPKERKVIVPYLL